MAFDGQVNDEDILNGFSSLHEAIESGFKQVESGFKRIDAEFQKVHGRIDNLENQIHDVRNDVARLEQRMLRRFDDVDAKLENHERRIVALEQRVS